MFVLYEDASGYAVFQVKDAKKFQRAEDVAAFFADRSNDPKDFYKLIAYEHFKDTKEALTAATNTLNAKSNDTLNSTISKVFKEGMTEQLAVADSNIGQIIKEESKLDIPFLLGDHAQELLRGISEHASKLLEGVTDSDLEAMRLGLAHSLSRYKLKFSPDKVDVMIVHSISLLDELDKELNNYVMRLREWYGWHFPELAKVVTDAVVYANLVIKVGFRTSFQKTDLKDFLEPEVEANVKQQAEISMGTEISELDKFNISSLAQQIVDLSEYREQLNAYLRERMGVIAPNLSAVVGELVGARLISHAGSLVNLAKHPASTIQILGAEKALFRALKTHKDTPKYGLIYHASLVSQCAAKDKGKMSRMLANKAALATRYDALSEETTLEPALQYLAQLRNSKLGKGLNIDSIKTPLKQESYKNVSTVVNVKTESSTLPGAESKVILVKQEPGLIVTDGDLQAANEAPAKKDKKKKKKKKSAAPEEEVMEVVVKEEPQEVPKSEKKKKKKKKTSEATEAEVIEIKQEPEEPKSEKKKKKKRKADEATTDAENVEVKKKKKKKSVKSADEQ